MPRLPTSTVFWHTVRVYAWYKLFKSINKYNLKLALSMKFKPAKLITILSLILGALAYQFLAKLMDKLLNYFLKIDALGSMDELLARNDI